VAENSIAGRGHRRKPAAVWWVLKGLTGRIFSLLKRCESCDLAMAAYPQYPIPLNESHRLRELERYGLDEASDDPQFCRILELAVDVLAVPIGLVSLVDDCCQRFLCRHGFEALSTPRDMAFCAHAIAGHEPLVVNDALQDERFNTNPLVVGPPHIRFYAGAPLCTERGYNLGTLCVLDLQPRDFDSQQVHRLKGLAALLMNEIEWRHRSQLCSLTGLHRRDAFFRLAAKEFRRAQERNWPLSLLTFDIDNFRQINMRWGHEAGDQVLIDLVSLCQNLVDADDLMARIYDEEFCLLIVGKDDQAALAIAELVRLSATEMQGVFSTSEYKIQISGGISSLSPSDQRFEDLYDRAEQAMLLAKNNGRNQIARLLSD
jgi:diguanylate cyclase (GGDEF)-like protein